MFLSGETERRERLDELRRQLNAIEEPGIGHLVGVMAELLFFIAEEI